MTSCEDIVKTEEEKIKFQVSHSKVLLELNILKNIPPTL